METFTESTDRGEEDHGTLRIPFLKGVEHRVTKFTVIYVNHISQMRKLRYRPDQEHTENQWQNLVNSLDHLIPRIFSKQ